MSTLAHAQGGLRPAFAHDPAFHPGLQIHAIAEPRRDRRLSLLISLLCYESLAAVAILTMQHKEALQAKLKTLPPIDLVETAEAVLTPRPEPNLPVAPAVIPSTVHDESLSQPRATETISDVLPQTLPTTDQRGFSTVGPDGNRGIPSNVLVPPSRGRQSFGDGMGTGTPVEISMAQVQILHQAEPVYPAMARIIKIHGDVVVRMTIDTTGAPADVKVVSGPEPLRPEALRCARLWRFTPARINGEAVPAAFNLTLRFVLR